MLMLACWQRRVNLVTVFFGKGYLDAKYTAPKVCPRLLNIGRHITERWAVWPASEENLESNEASS
jgi:hypothetical protein